MHIIARFTTIILLGLFAFIPQKTPAQEKTKPAPMARPMARPMPASQTPITIFPLKNALAAETAEMLVKLFGAEKSGKVRITADSRLNALFVQAPEAQLKQIRDLIQSTDQERPNNERAVKVFRLVNIKADQQLIDMLSIVADDKTSLAIDPTGGVVAAGPESSLAVIEALLMRIDEHRPRKADAGMSELQVRLVWLVKGLQEETAAPPPKDLENVIGELTNIGVTDLKMAAQMVVNTSMDHVFTTSGSAKLDAPCNLEVTGAVSKSGRVDLFQQGQRAGGSVQFRGGRSRARQARFNPADGLTISSAPFKLQLRIAATSQDSKSPVHCQLETTIQAPLGQSVVLGVTPIDGMTSVFVVQIRGKN